MKKAMRFILVLLALALFLVSCRSQRDHGLPSDAQSVQTETTRDGVLENGAQRGEDVDLFPTDPPTAPPTDFSIEAPDKAPENPPVATPTDRPANPSTDPPADPPEAEEEQPYQDGIQLPMIPG